MRPTKTQISLRIRVWPVFVVHKKKLYILGYTKCAQRRFWSDCAKAGRTSSHSVQWYIFWRCGSAYTHNLKIPYIKWWWWFQCDLVRRSLFEWCGPHLAGSIYLVVACYSVWQQRQKQWKNCAKQQVQNILLVKIWKWCRQQEIPTFLNQSSNEMHFEDKPNANSNGQVYINRWLLTDHLTRNFGNTENPMLKIGIPFYDTLKKILRIITNYRCLQDIETSRNICTIFTTSIQTDRQTGLSKQCRPRPDTAYLVVFRHSNM